MNIKNLFNINTLVNACKSLVFSGFYELNFSYLTHFQTSFPTIINIRITMKPAPVAGFSVYNGLITRATKTFRCIITSITHFTENHKNSKIRGEVNILHFSYKNVRTNSDQKVYGQSRANILFSHLQNVFMMGEGITSLFYYPSLKLKECVFSTPVRYNGGQLYIPPPKVNFKPSIFIQ